MSFLRSVRFASSRGPDAGHVEPDGWSHRAWHVQGLLSFSLGIARSHDTAGLDRRYSSDWQAMPDAHVKNLADLEMQDALEQMLGVEVCSLSLAP